MNGPLPNDFANPANAAAYIVQVYPATAPQDPATADLVDRLRAEVISGAVEGSTLAVNVTGFVPLGVDFTDYLATRTPVFFAAVLVLSFLLLLIVFRSILVPIKAVVMNLLSIAACLRAWWPPSSSTAGWAPRSASTQARSSRSSR